MRLADLAGKTVVLYFYPKDRTPGCTVEACGFRDANAALQAAGEWSLDEAHTTVTFLAKHLGVSKTRGQFKDFDAIVEAEKDGRLTAATATIKVASIDTGVEKRDSHLKAADFFDAEKFPTLTFKTTSVTIEGRTATLVGDLTIKDKTERVTLKGEFLGKTAIDFGQGPSTHAGYSVKTQINRQKFGLAFNAMAEGSAVVSDLIDIELEFEIMK